MLHVAQKCSMHLMPKNTAVPYDAQNAAGGTFGAQNAVHKYCLGRKHTRFGDTAMLSH